MFHKDRWARAFLAVSGKDADDVFLCLKALIPPVKSVHGIFFGHVAAAKLEKILREGAGLFAEGSSKPVEYAIRFICLLVEKNCFRYVDSLLEKIELILDEQKGIFHATVECAVTPEGGFEEELARSIREKTGAVSVKLKISVRPELLEGFLLRIGGFYIDSSLKGQLEDMKADLMETARIASGGKNGEL